MSGTLSGLNLVFNAPSVTYGNCPGLTTTSQGQAVAVSPIPGSTPNRANVVISILGGTRVAAAHAPVVFLVFHSLWRSPRRTASMSRSIRRS